MAYVITTTVANDVHITVCTRILLSKRHKFARHGLTQEHWKTKVSCLFTARFPGTARVIYTS